jgi:hypothetical protein
MVIKNFCENCEKQIKNYLKSDKGFLNPDGLEPALVDVVFQQLK